MKKRTSAGEVALGGVLAALAVVIMCLGGLVPVMTYVCPLILALMLEVVRLTCGNRIAWAWYGAVAILGLLLGPDREAAFLFVFLGYYPIVKPKLDRLPLSLLWKVLLFNAATAAAYGILLNLAGMDALRAEFREMGHILLTVTILLGNMVFFLLDRLLVMLPRKWQGRHG